MLFDVDEPVDVTFQGGSGGRTARKERRRSRRETCTKMCSERRSRGLARGAPRKSLQREILLVLGGSVRRSPHISARVPARVRAWGPVASPGAIGMSGRRRARVFAGATPRLATRRSRAWRFGAFAVACRTRWSRPPRSWRRGCTTGTCPARSVPSSPNTCSGWCTPWASCAWSTARWTRRRRASSPPPS